MITKRQILEAMATAILADAPVLAWVAANCQKSLTVQIGEDGARPAGEEDCPIVILTPGLPSDVGEDVEQHRHTVEVDWLIRDDRIDRSTAGLVVYEGTLAADDIGQLLYTAILAFSTNVTVSRAGYWIDSVLAWPLVQGGMTIHIDVPTLIGAEIAL